MPQPTMLREGESVTLSGRKCDVVRGINRGGSAEVYEVMHQDSRHALKIFYPFYYEQYGGLTEDSFNSIIHMQQNECEIIRGLAHPGIVRVFDSGLYRLRAIDAKRLGQKVSELPYILEEFVDGDQISKTLDEKKITQEDVCLILNRICSALLYVHKQRYLHCDLKADNILLRKETLEPVLIDFGLAKDLSFVSRPRERITPVLGDWDMMPWLPADHPLKRMREHASGSAGELFDLAFPTLDIYNFGQLLKQILDQVGYSIEKSARDYLRLLAEQLANWEIARTWTTEMLADRVSRLSPTRYSLLGIPELAPPTTTVRTIMIPPDVGVPVTRRLQAFLNNRSFRRLSHINQLGLLSFVYPGADYKRQLHVLHTYHLCRLLVPQLYSNPIFRLHFGETTSLQLLIMSLLHDINHFPFLHVFQEAKIEGLQDMDLVDLFCSGDVTTEKANGEPSIRDLLWDIGLDLPQFTRLLFHSDHTTPAHQIISSVINSGADVDKMSYLFLDGHFTGVPFGRGLDLAGLLKSATITQEPSSGALHLAFYDRGLQAVENLALTRLWHFRSMYWHHTNRALMAMLLDVVKTLYTHPYSIRNYVDETMWKSISMWFNT